MDVVARMSALGQLTRLAAMTLLMDAGDAGVSVGELAKRITIPANSMSTHLAILARAGLLKSHRIGRSKIYTACPSAIAGLADHLADGLFRAPWPAAPSAVTMEQRVRSTST